MKVHDNFPNVKCNFQKQVRFTTQQFQIVVAGFKTEMAEIFQGSQTAWNKILKPALNTIAPAIGKAGGAKTKNPKWAQTRTNVSKSMSAGKVLPLNDL